MERARQTAVVARQLVAAGAAQQHRRVAAAVAQQDHLLAAVERGAHLVEQPLRQHHLARLARGRAPRAGRPGFLPAADRRRRAAGRSQTVTLPRLGVAARLEAGRRRGQDGHRARLVRAHQREIARVIARGVLLLEGGVVLLVDHDDAQPLDRREHRRARARARPARSPIARAPTPARVRLRRAPSAGSRAARRIDAAPRRRARAPARSRAPGRSRNAPPRARARSARR